MALPLVSIILSMRNSAATIGAAVRSVQLQTLRDWELIVIDDGSSDRSAEIVDGFGDARIRLVREPVSAGLAPRLNQAVTLSRGDFIARMDADDICFPDRLSRQVEQLQQEPQLDVVGCAAVVFTDGHELVGRLPIGVTHQQITARPCDGFPFPHPTWCGRAAWFRNNPYDAALMKAEDQDLLLRTFRTSRFGGLEDVLLGYRQNQLDLRKLLPGRRTFIGSLWRYGARTGEHWPALGGIVLHFVKGVVDVITVGLGLNRLAQRRRLQQVPPEVAERWQELRQQLDLDKAAS
ncbi:glycosyltransferase family A protein [Bradyrhizobium prioriisuperbiae]|uniref:glycosyltransferase family 2 protein n=1 Tax=Bradyrhizobium prioriisuperbiae TaxID=2854389 RepID=UPI0028EB676C|nr:glycosyltransferase family A protein [Bradyrhizobium prioritasuperba]